MDYTEEELRELEAKATSIERKTYIAFLAHALESTSSLFTPPMSFGFATKLYNEILKIDPSFIEFFDISEFIKTLNSFVFANVKSVGGAYSYILSCVRNKLNEKTNIGEEEEKI
jgi:hypothetical protein